MTALLLPARTKKTIQELKDEYVDYYRDVPIQKYAAMFIGRDEDTVIRWRKEDGDFADAVQRARAEWVRKRVIGAKAEFALERLEKELFSPAAAPTTQVSIYAQTVESIQARDPNTPDNKSLVDETLALLMEKTKRKPAPTSP